jgi:hypothetical protein
MKRFRLILLLIGVVLISYFLARNKTPHSAFKRHFGGDVSGSVTQIAVSGHTALAGSNEVLTFNVSDEDLKTILAQRGFSEVTQLVKDGKATGIRASEWIDDIEKAASFGISGSHFYEISKLEGLVYYILIADEKTNRVFYHYYKT